MADMPSDPQAPLYTAIGVIAVQWAYIEISIDMCIYIIYHKFNGKSIFNRIPKTRFNEKCTKLKTAFNDLTMLNQYKSEGLFLIADAENYSEHRHRILHGSVIKAVPDIMHYTKIIYGKEFHKFDYYEYTLIDLLNYGKKFQDLAIRLASLRDQLIKDAASQEFG